MSLQAMTWALAQQAVLRPIERHVLLCLANYAGEDGRHAFPSVARLMRDTGYKRRAIQMALRALEEAGVIAPGEQRIVSAFIERADCRPQVYDLRLDVMTKERLAEDGAGLNAETDRIEPERGACHAPRTGRISRHDGAHLTTSRGACHAPDPSLNRQLKEARARASEPDGSPAPAPEGSGTREGEAGGGAAKGLGEGSGGRGGQPERTRRAPTPLERQRFHERTFVLDWLFGREPYPATFRALDLRETREAGEIEAMALSLSPVALRAVQGFVRWADAIVAGDPESKPPIAAIEPLVKAMADQVQRATMQRRLNMLMRMEFGAGDEGGADAPAEDADTDETERSEGKRDRAPEAALSAEREGSAAKDLTETERSEASASARPQAPREARLAPQDLTETESSDAGLDQQNRKAS